MIVIAGISAGVFVIKLIWKVIMVNQLRNVPKEKIIAMADFFQKDKATIPFTNIFKVLKGKE